MPRNSGIPFVMSMFWFTAGFGFVFDWVWMTVAGLAGVAVCMLVHSFNYNTGYYIPVEEITRTEAALRGNTSMAHINDSVHAGHPAPHSDHHDHPDMEEMRTFGFWIYLMTDVIIFGTLFAAYIVLQPNRNGGPGPEDLFQLGGIIASTIILLTSSYTSGLAVLAMHRGKLRALLGWLGVTALLGTAFIVLEVSEFIHLVHEGATISTSAFLSAFYTLVGTHGLHVSIGLVWMIALMIQLAKHGITPVTKRKVNVISLFWHFLDVVWIFVFTIVYLMGVR